MSVPGKDQDGDESVTDSVGRGLRRPEDRVTVDGESGHGSSRQRSGAAALVVTAWRTTTADRAEHLCATAAVRAAGHTRVVTLRIRPLDAAVSVRAGLH